MKPDAGLIIINSEQGNFNDVEIIRNLCSKNLYVNMVFLTDLAEENLVGVLLQHGVSDTLNKSLKSLQQLPDIVSQMRERCKGKPKSKNKYISREIQVLIEFLCSNSNRYIDIRREWRILSCQFSIASNIGFKCKRIL